MMRRNGMSPSPGTSRCDDATVPTLKSLTCTSRMRSTPSVIVRREITFGPARVHLHAHAGVEAAREVDGVAQGVHEPDVDAQRVRVLDRERRRPRLRASASTGASAASNASAASSQVSGTNGPVVNTIRGAPTARAVAIDRTSRSCCCSQRFGSRELERAESDEVGDLQAVVDRALHELGSLLPAERFELRHRDTDRGRCRAHSRTQGLRRATAGRSRSR